VNRRQRRLPASTWIPRISAAIAATILATSGAAAKSSGKQVHRRGAASGCIAGEPDPPAGLQPIGEARGDFDGDGRTDRLQLFHLRDDRRTLPGDAGPSIETHLVARAVFGNGATSPISDPLFPSSVSEQVIGIADLDGDGRDEVFLHVDGATYSSAGVLTVRSCKVVPVKDADGRPYEFGYYGHSLCCPRSGNAFFCPARTDGRKGRDLIESEYAADLDGIEPDDRSPCLESRICCSVGIVAHCDSTSIGLFW